MDKAQRRAMRSEIMAAKERLRSRGGNKLLSFRQYKEEGWIMATDANSLRLLCDLWNNAEEILGD